MDATVIEVLVNHITQFGSLSPKSEYAQRYYEKIVEILSLLNSVLDKVLASEISLTGKIKNILEELDGHINNARELLESWHQLSSKLYFALHVEYAITKIQACTKETFQLVHLIFESLPDKSHLACVESCLQKTEDLVYEPILEFIKGAMNDQSENLDLDSGPVLKISNALSLSSNEELLMEAVALDKLKTKLGQVESPEDLEYIDPLVSLINRMHDSYVRAHQLPSMNDIQIPADFCCPLSLKLMSDPVIVASGQTYERAFIRKWLDHGLTFCPKTRQPLGHANLIPNYTVKALIANWCESNNIKLSDPARSATLTQPSTFAAYVDTDAVDDSNLSRFGHPKNLISRSAELARSTPSSNGTGSLANGFSSAAGRISAEELSSGSLGQLPDQPKMECSSGGKELDGHETTSSASGAEYVRGEEGSDVSGEMVAQEAAASSSSQSGRQPEPRSRGQNQSTWRRPTDRFIPRIISSPSVDTRPDLSEVEADVRRLIEDLKSESVELQRNATQELRLLAKHNMENRIVIANCGAVSHLVNLLLSTDAKTQENAVTALLNLSINDNNKIAIANADAISPLILVLETGNPEAKENSAATLFSLSVIEENKVKIGRSGAIKPLVELLGNGTPRGKRDAATALFNLSIFHENKARIVQAGAVKHLVELMDPAAGMVDKAVAVLANIATIHEGRIAIGQEGGIPALVEVVELGSARGKENAAAALLHLCTNSNKFCTMVLQEGAVPPLVALSQSGTPRAREKAQLLLTHFRNQRHGGGRS